MRVLRNERQPYALVMADLDHFKDLNDTYGHETGDRALRLFADTLRASLRTEDLLCRHGGEEFALVLPACDLTDACAALEAVRLQLVDALRASGLPRYTASFGVVVAAPGEALDSATRRADVALFQAKREGRDRIIADAVPAYPVDDVPSNGHADARAASVGLSVRRRARSSPGTRPSC